MVLRRVVPGRCAVLRRWVAPTWGGTPRGYSRWAWCSNPGVFRRSASLHHASFAAACRWFPRGTRVSAGVARRTVPRTAAALKLLQRVLHGGLDAKDAILQPRDAEDLPNLRVHPQSSNSPFLRQPRENQDQSPSTEEQCVTPAKLITIFWGRVLVGCSNLPQLSMINRSAPSDR